MKIGLLRRFTKEDHPEMEDKFLQQLNNILEEHTTALMRGLTFEDNLRAEVIRIDMPNDIQKTIQLRQLKRNPIIGLIGGTNYFEYPEFTWQRSPDKALAVDVKVKWEMPPDQDVRCTFVFFGGEPDNRNEV